MRIRQQIGTAAFRPIPRAALAAVVGVVACVACLMPVPALGQDGSATAENPSQTRRLTPGQRQELKHLLVDLKDERLELPRRRRAASILLSRNWPAAMHVLRQQLLSETGPDTRRAIARAVAGAQNPPPMLLDPLVKLLASQQEAVRRDAATALGQYDRPELAARLRRIATDPDQPEARRLGAIAALAEYRTQETAGALLDVAANEPDPIRGAAFDALGRLTGLREYGQELQRWQQWWRDARQLSREKWLTRLMRQVSGRNTELAEDLRHLRERLTRVYDQLYETAGEQQRAAILKQMLSDPMAQVRLRALKLIDRRLLNAQPIDAEVRSAMRRRLTDGSAQVRAQAAQLLENLKDEQAARQAADLLLGETEPQVQAAYLSLLARVPQPRAVEPALLLIGRPATRSAAASLLIAADQQQMLEGDQATRALAAARQHVQRPSPPEPPMLRLLGRLGTEADRSRLVEHLDAERDEVRLAAAEALAQPPWPLAPLLDHLDDRTLQPVILQAISRRGASVEAVEALLANKPQEMDLTGDWQKALMAVAPRLGPEGLAEVDAMLAQRADGEALRRRMLTEAAGTLAANGDGEAEPDGGAVEAALRLAKVQEQAGQPAKAASIYQRLSARDDLAADHRQRLVADRLGLMLGADPPKLDQAAEYTDQVLDRESGIGAQAVAAPWLEALQRRVEAGRMEAARTMHRRAAELLDGVLTETQQRRLAGLSERIESVSPVGPTDGGASSG